MYLYVLTFYMILSYNATKEEEFMRITKEHAEYGLIVFEENVWTGKKKLSINGKPLQKVGKTTFTGEEAKRFFLKEIILPDAGFN